MLRVALYSHDTYGLGHFRRCLKLAWFLSERFAGLEGVFLSGSPWTDAFELPPGFRVVRLPAVVKLGRRRYAPRRLDVGIERLVSQRTATIRRALADLRPDLFVVDNVPAGLHGEVRAALDLPGPRRPLSVLVLRDILDDPLTAAREWHSVGAVDAAQTLFEEIWCFGDDEDVAALTSNGPLAEISTPIVACGHLGWPRTARRQRVARRDPRLPGSPHDHELVLVTAGGGGDGGPLVESCARAMRHLPETRGRIVPGPDIPTDVEARLRSAVSDNVRLERFVPDIDRQFHAAALVISMAGYNTVCEILAAGCPAFLAPRSHPRREQLLRARRLAARGRVTLLEPSDLEPRRLAGRIRTALAEPRRFPAEIQPGGERAAERVTALLAPEPRREVI